MHVCLSFRMHCGIYTRLQIVIGMYVCGLRTLHMPTHVGGSYRLIELSLRPAYNYGNSNGAVSPYPKDIVVRNRKEFYNETIIVSGCRLAVV